MSNNDISKAKNGVIMGNNDQRGDKESGNEVGQTIKTKTHEIKRIDLYRRYRNTGWF